MKRVTLLFATIIGCYCLNVGICTANAAGKGKKVQNKVAKSTPKKVLEDLPKADVSVSEVNAVEKPKEVMEPNKKEVEKDILEKEQDELQQLERNRQRAARKWMEGNAEEKTSMMRMVNRQVETELKFLRKLAQEEEATKTVAAIDRLIKNREAFSKKILERINKKKSGPKQREERRSRTDRPARRGKRERSSDRSEKVREQQENKREQDEAKEQEDSSRKIKTRDGDVII
ncbi:MAG: hypothetical protein JXB29_11260 [Sedimentisphaerales bacterium]|nr:hypothetical protein [Sedimentisphaerales bacterium]